MRHKDKDDDGHREVCDDLQPSPDIREGVHTGTAQFVHRTSLPPPPMSVTPV